MRVDLQIRDVRESLSAVIRGLDNQLTASENFAPEGTTGQVLTSNGPSEPPSYQDIVTVIEDVLRTHGLIP